MRAVEFAFDVDVDGGVDDVPFVQLTQTMGERFSPSARAVLDGSAALVRDDGEDDGATCVSGTGTRLVTVCCTADGSGFDGSDGTVQPR